MFSRALKRQCKTLLGTSRFSSSFTTVSQGSKFTPDYKKYLKLSNGQIGSFFHDVPMSLNKEAQTVNVVIEIPRWTNAKFEINKSLQFNPITQDIKKGQPRFVKNLFPFKGYIHNYGAIPQTWDDPTIQDKDTGFNGDNDPIDVCDIGDKIAEIGDVYKAKILGSLALIDDGELDWKIIVINSEDPLSRELSDIGDVLLKCPGLLESTKRWFRDYKVPDGKGRNEFGFNGEFLNAEKTIEVIEHSNQSWKALVRGQVTGIKEIPNGANTTLEDTPGYSQVSEDEVIDSKLTNLPDSELPSSVEKVYYVKTE